jgi:SAM-dependent methyltransferase
MSISIHRNPLPQLHQLLPGGASVLDVGCHGFGQRNISHLLGRTDVLHAGVDYCTPAQVPKDFDFRLADLNQRSLPFEDDSFDLVVASHIMEHLEDPVRFFGDCLRVCKPGGTFFVATPSERSLWLPGFPFEHEKFYSLSFFDDPTHSRRPFTPVSLVRLSRYYSCTEVAATYSVDWRWRIALPFAVTFALICREGWLLERAIWAGCGWECVAVVRKPSSARGTLPFNYFIPSMRADGPVLRAYQTIRRFWSRDAHQG